MKFVLMENEGLPCRKAMLAQTKDRLFIEPDDLLDEIEQFLEPARNFVRRGRTLSQFVH
jgi:hypothetical protein